MSESSTEFAHLDEDGRRDLRGAVLTALMLSDWAGDAGKIRAVLMADLYETVALIAARARLDAEAERDATKTALTSVWVAADRASRKGYELDPHDVLEMLGEDNDDA